jgi:hypothetical protein
MEPLGILSFQPGDDSPAQLGGVQHGDYRYADDLFLFAGLGWVALFWAFSL